MAARMIAVAGMVLLMVSGARASCKQVDCTECTTDGKRCVACSYRQVLINGVCKDCVTKPGSDDGYICSQCNSRDPTRCQKCISFLSYPEVTGYVAANGACKACPSNCLKCARGTGKCTECNPGYRPNARGTCSACRDKNCAKCPNSIATCTECKTKLYEMPYAFTLVKGKCVACADPECGICNAGPNKCTLCTSFNFAGPNGTCESCGGLCVRCTSKTNCTRCFNGQGVIQTATGARCAVCSDPNCITCDGDRTRCTRCGGYSRSPDPKTGRCILCKVPHCDGCDPKSAYSCDFQSCSPPYKNARFPDGTSRCIMPKA